MSIKLCSPPLFVFLVLFLLAGCNSVYHHARDRVPPGREATLALRLDEARAAEAEAGRIAALLQSAEAEGSVILRDRVNQLDVASSELDRMLLSVRDVADGEFPIPQDQDELTRLELRSRGLQDVLAAARLGDWQTADYVLRVWLERSNRVAGGA